MASWCLTAVGTEGKLGPYLIRSRPLLYLGRGCPLDKGKRRARASGSWARGVLPSRQDRPPECPVASLSGLRTSRVALTGAQASGRGRRAGVFVRARVCAAIRGPEPRLSPAVVPLCPLPISEPHLLALRPPPLRCRRTRVRSALMPRS